LIEVQHAFGFDLKVRVARENPTAMLPGPDGVFLQPAPEGAAADAGHQPPAGDFLDQIPPAVAGQRPAVLVGQFARQGFDLQDQFRGGNGRTPGTGKIFQTVQAFLKKALAPLANDLSGQRNPVGNLVIAQALGGQKNCLGSHDYKIR